MVVPVHEVNFACHVDLGEDHLILCLHCLSILLLNDVSNLADFALA